MLFLSCNFEPNDEIKNAIRREIIERTGEDCLIFPDYITGVLSIPVKKDETASKFEAASNSNV